MIYFVPTSAVQSPRMGIVYDAAPNTYTSKQLEHLYHALETPAISELFGKVASLRNWGVDWPEYQGMAPDAAAISFAATWIEDIYRNALKAGQRWITPLITASEEGEVVFEWWHGQKKLTVTILGQTAVAVKRTGVRPHISREEVAAVSPQSRTRLWAWLAE